MFCDIIIIGDSMKKGFTLVELLVTIGVLVLILLIVTPSLVGVINNSREKSFEETERSIITAARLYMNYNRENRPGEIGQNYYIDILTLQDEGYLERGIVNPITGDLMVGAYVVVTNTEQGFEYELEYDY